MKHFIHSCLLLLVSLWGLNAQNQSREVIGAAGEISSSPTISLEWTLGEIATSTHTLPKGILTEGFHQPFITIENVAVEALPESLQGPVYEHNSLTFSVYPNPTASSLWVDIAAQIEARALLLLTDLNGTVLYQQPTRLLETTLELDLTSYAAGSYYLLLKDEKGDMLKATKILKIH